MKNKKLLIGILSVCCLATCAFSAACAGGNNVNNSEVSSGAEISEEEIKAEVLLDKEMLELEVYDKATLTATVSGTNAALTWSSSAPAVVSVDNKGNLVAKGVGTAMITAQADDAVATCAVTVNKETTAPKIQLNAEEVYLNINGEYTSSVKALWKGEEIEEAVTYTWTVVDGEKTDVVTMTPGDNEVTFVGASEGTTVVRVSADIRGTHVSEDIVITVYENELMIVANNPTLRPQKGYYTLDLATADIEEYVSTGALDFCVYANDEIVDAPIVWSTDYDAEIINLDGNTVLGKKAGEVELVGTCTANGLSKSVTVRINVEKPVILLAEPTKPFLEVENLQEFTISSQLQGSIESVTLHGKEVLASVSNQTVLLAKENMPTASKQLGEQELYVSTEYITYRVPALIYTMIINDKAEMDEFVEISKACATKLGQWDGYFLLGNDIDYNGDFVPMTSHNHLYALGGDAKNSRYDPTMVGFRGVFDGCGYNIDGLAIGINKAGGVNAEAGIFGVIHVEGVVRNISFTNAISRENSGYVAASGGGLIENVSIIYKQIGVGAQNTLFGDNDEPRIMSSFFSTKQGVGSMARVRNCIVDASQATIIWDETTEARYKWYSIALAGTASIMENVMVFCPNEALAKASGAVLAYTSYDDFLKDGYAVSEYEAWDAAFWTNINGIPFTVGLANKIDKDAAISFDALPEVLFVGSGAEVKTVGDYTKVALLEAPEGVTLQGGVLSATEEASGKKVTLQLTSYLNDQVVEAEVLVAQKQDVTLTQTERLLLDTNSTTIDLSIAAEYNGEKATAKLGADVIGEGEIVDGKLAINPAIMSEQGYGERVISVVSEKGGVYYGYDVNVLFVTKILTKAEDFAALVIPQGTYSGQKNFLNTGYYIVGNDIDCTGFTTASDKAYPMWDQNVGFRGTFDGNGKTISNLTVDRNGLFGQIGKGAVIKNVTFDKVTYKNTVSTALLAFAIKGATIENITINVASYATYTHSEAFSPEHGLLSSRYLQNNTITNVTIHAEGFAIGSLFGRVENSNTYTNVAIYAKSYKYLGDETDSNPFNSHTELPAGVTFVADAA